MPLATLFLLAAAPAQSAVAPYRAIGTEPFWSLTIDGSTIRYTPVSGRAITVAKPRPIRSRGGEIYRTPRLSVAITNTPCSDGMSDRRYADTVRVTIGRQVLNGCGGRILTEAAEPLAGTWRIDLVDGRRVPLGRAATLSFNGERVSGRICNSFGGQYRFQHGTLTTREIIGTQMACMDGGTQVENAVYAALRRPLKVHRGSRGDTLVLSDARSSLTLRRQD